MRGYFAIGIEGVNKAGNMGNLIRTAHGFDAAFTFSITPQITYTKRTGTDTSKAAKTIPYYEFNSLEEMVLPKGCQIVGIELIEDAIDLPTFRHPLNAAYILGSERLSLSEGLIVKCDHVIKIPTKFCLNVATAGAIVMYDRSLIHGRYPQRALTTFGEVEPLKEHVRGGPVLRKLSKKGK
ncbi:MAG: RNA methyltransferase [Sphingomonadales bacterium]|jgi:tRNA G18 (ribose-2'-O)-methylase SpoU